MTPRHRTARSPRLRFAPWLVVALVVVVLAGGATAALELTGGAGPAPSTTVSSSAAPGTPVPGESAGDLPTGASATPGADRSTESARAARGADRAATTSSPTPSASPTPTAARPSTPAAADSSAGSAVRTADSTTVVDSGTCGASYYASGQVTANGESFDPSGLTAAHRTLAFGTKVRVTNPQTGAAVVVRINDRGPFVDGRCLDLARGAFEKIAALAMGHLEVRYEILGD
ncbi:septal ring lytic transglycosylase RlpA family protein [Micromonospora sp. NBC_01813]|uniref:septal ring lytic transglycosylase RlpA family protein n=1 Tax=Micromonospora sp. NBC_01813 TaxID=2975988 RepID=UPI002DDAC948|nr:septal ring lytic transglycosylase RlpA family protein [Micromonospora sp. NBC_01813]WSA07436.1 septal ring lytic transglycosylase RlpA family protein [Micromonospora sp. NBC_01813]